MFCCFFLPWLGSTHITLPLDQISLMQLRELGVANVEEVTTHENEIPDHQEVNDEDNRENFGEYSGSIRENSKTQNNFNDENHIDSLLDHTTYNRRLSPIPENENENEDENGIETNPTFSSYNMKSTLIKQIMDEQVKEKQERDKLNQAKNVNQSNDCLIQPVFTIKPAKVVLKRLSSEIVQQFGQADDKNENDIKKKRKMHKKKI